MTEGVWIGIGGFVLMLVLIFMGVPIFISLFLCSIIGFWMVGGSGITLLQFTEGPYTITASFIFAVVPMFVLMGIIAGEAGLAEDSYYAANKWVSKLRGGVLMTIIGANAIFGAVSGIAIGTTAIFTKLSLPELEKQGYDRRMSMACLATAGVLDSLIPPSVPILLFCIIVDLSIGRALVAGIIPGIVTMVVLALTVWVIGIIDPRKVPAGSKVSIPWRERFAALNKMWIVLVLFLLVIGGVYAGWFASTVGGAIGSFGILVYGLASRRLNLKKILNALWDTATISAQIFPLVLSGFMFSRFISLSGLAGAMMNFITSSQLPALGVLLIVLIFYIIMGCLMDIMAIMIITLPVIFPLLVNLGYDPYALVVVLIFMMSIAGLTPPIGMSVFVVSSIAKVDPSEVFRGIIPFFLVQLALCFVFIFFPQIATWLPNLLYGVSSG